MNQFGFSGSYSSVRRLAQKLRKEHPHATCILDFAPGEAAHVDFGNDPTIKDVFSGEIIPTSVFGGRSGKLTPLTLPPPFFELPWR